jgi:hypothetical protein
MAKKRGMDCPIQAKPYCHPRERIIVFIDHRTGTITLSCAFCERTLGIIHIKKYDPRTSKKSANKSKRKGKQSGAGPSAAWYRKHPRFKEDKGEAGQALE